MPTILRLNGLRIAIYPNDHRPPHVHVIGAKGEAIVLLNCPAGPATLRENYGFNAAELTTLAASLLAQLATLCTAWETIHGNL